MPLAATRARESPVCDLADELVLERELRMFAKARDRVAADEIATFERVQRLGARVAERAGPEHLADDGRIEQRLALRCGQRVNPRRNDAADARWQLVRL